MPIILLIFLFFCNTTLSMQQQITASSSHTTVTASGISQAEVQHEFTFTRQRTITNNIIKLTISLTRNSTGSRIYRTRNFEVTNISKSLTGKSAINVTPLLDQDSGSNFKNNAEKAVMRPVFKKCLASLISMSDEHFIPSHQVSLQDQHFHFSLLPSNSIEFTEYVIEKIEPSESFNLISWLGSFCAIQ